VFLPATDEELSWVERIREGLGHRATGLAVALVIEALLVLLLLTLGQSTRPRNTGGLPVATFDVSPAPEEAPPPAEQEKSTPSAFVTPQPRPDTPEPQPAPTTTPVPAFIPLPRDQMARADIAPPVRKPSPPAPSNQPAYGPPDSGTPGPPDSVRVGTAPDGEPLYAARWYREPYDDELRGYLSTASGPGWGLIACRTAPDWRVEDCVALGESPLGSNIARSVLAAAWQFKVRPPRLGGKSLVGAWVRIRIDYDLQRK
jgi:protein TonB